MTVNELYHACENIDREAYVFIYNSMKAYQRKEKPVFRCEYYFLPNGWAIQSVARFSIQNDGDDVYILLSNYGE